MKKIRTWVSIYGVDYGFMKSPRGNFSDKQNRAVKLAMMFEELSDKFDGMISRGGFTSETARLALACKLMLYTGIRIGNEGSAEGYMTKPHPNSKVKPQFVQTYGLTTLKREHVYVKGRKVFFMFLGKKHVDNTFEIGGTLAKQMRTFLKLYSDDTLFGISAYQLTKFVKRYVGQGFKPKDFRTLRANMLAYEMYEEISDRELPTTKKDRNAELKEVAAYVAEFLNNTPGVCKASYIDGDLLALMEEERSKNLNRK